MTYNQRIQVLAAETLAVEAEIHTLECIAATLDTEGKAAIARAVERLQPTLSLKREALKLAIA